MKKATEQAKEQGRFWLDSLEVADWQVQFLLLDEGDRAHPKAMAPPGQWVRSKQSAARDLLDRLRSVAGAHAFARIRAYLSTLRKQGLSLLSALQATLSGHPVLPSFS